MAVEVVRQIEEGFAVRFFFDTAEESTLRAGGLATNRPHKCNGSRTLFDAELLRL